MHNNLSTVKVIQQILTKRLWQTPWVIEQLNILNYKNIVI